MPGKPPIRIACCLCGKPIPQASDVYALDEEWRRRFPRMVGILACDKCAVGHYWSCLTPDGASYVEGHRRAAGQPEKTDQDSWSHVQDWGAHATMVCRYPRSGLQQGAEDYLRSTVHRSHFNRELARRIQEALDQWDTQG